MELLRWILGLTITVFLAALGVMNRQSVDFYFSPLHTPLHIPIYLLFLMAAAFGFLFGAFVTWLNMSDLRQAKRSQKQEIKSLKETVERLNKTEITQPPSKEFFTALPPKV